MEKPISARADEEAVEGVPVLEFIEDFHDFGTIRQGEVVSYTFSFSNSGTAPLIIRHVIAGCGCTKSKVSKDVLKPGEKATLEVVFNSKGWSGSQYKTVTLRTNDANREKTVTFKANVV